jgi:sugar-specific transcriptional regulator TrmB
MDLLEALNKIGFTEYEAKVYLALLDENPATGYQISKTSTVPRSMVYETLSRLAARGAVLEAIEGRSTLYRPLPPDLLLNQHKEEFDRMVDRLRGELGERYLSSEEDSIWSINGTDAVYTYAVNMVDNAERELYLVLPDAALDILQDSIEAACQRGVITESVLTGEEELSCGEVVVHPPLETKLHGLADTLIVVADGQEVLIADTAQGRRSTITQNQNLVMIARQFIWMEMFTQRINAQLRPELLAKLSPEDRAILQSQYEDAS